MVSTTPNLDLIFLQAFEYVVCRYTSEVRLPLGATRCSDGSKKSRLNRHFGNARDPARREGTDVGLGRVERYGNDAIG